jgi:hypothetical protein
MNYGILQKTRRATLIDYHMSNNLNDHLKEWQYVKEYELFLNGLRNPQDSDWSKYEKYLLVLNQLINDNNLCKDVIGLIFSNIYAIEVMICQTCDIKNDIILNSKSCFKCFIVVKRNRIEQNFCDNCMKIRFSSICLDCYDFSDTSSDDEWRYGNFNFSDTSDDSY